MDPTTLTAFIQQLQESQRDISDKMMQATVSLQRIATQLENQERASAGLLDNIRRLDGAVFGMDLERPGLGMRLDRIEQRYLRTQRVQNWILSGGVAAFVTGLVMAYKGVQALSDSGVVR